MARPIPTKEMFSGVRVDIEHGKVFWVQPPWNHPRLAGKEAGSPRPNHSGKLYWHVKVGGRAFKRSHIVFLFKTGAWPLEEVDHRNGSSLDDRGDNLRPATSQQNAWNRKHYAKVTAEPMGVRKLGEGRYQARIACNKKQMSLGVYPTSDQAEGVYLSKRQELFGEYA